MNIRNIIRIITIIIISAAVPACRSGEKAGRAVVPSQAAWEGTWQSSVNRNSSGTISALFPEPLPKNTEFMVKATISYGTSPGRIEKTVTTAMTGQYREDPDKDGSAARAGQLRFKGVIVEAGQTISYVALPNREFTEFHGEYESLKPDDRGTFSIRKTKSLP